MKNKVTIGLAAASAACAIGAGLAYFNSRTTDDTGAEDFVAEGCCECTECDCGNGDDSACEEPSDEDDDSVDMGNCPTDVAAMYANMGIGGTNADGVDVDETKGIVPDEDVFVPRRFKDPATLGEETTML